MKIQSQILAVITALYFFYIEGYILYTAIGVALTVYFSFQFVNNVGRTYPIREFIILLSLFQWVVGAKLSYIFGKTHYKYYMYVDEETYMSYIVPAILFFIAGLYLVKVPLELEKIRDYIKLSDINTQKRIAFYITLVGVLSPIINTTFQISGLGFVFYLGSILTFVGASYFIFIYPHRRWLIFFCTIGLVFYQSILQGMFHSLLLTGAFLIFIIFNRRDSMLKKLTFIVLGVTMSYFIQLVKHDYRGVIWQEGTDVNAFEAFSNLILNEFTSGGNDYNYLNPGSEQTEEQAGVNVRLNQGWIISKVLENIPLKKEQLNGKTVSQALEASFLPRILFPDKPSTNDALKNFEEITGLRLGENTSMGLSVVAELYANYGTYGGWIAMLVYGFVISTVMKLLITKVARNSPIIILWFVFFFFQVVKAETDLIKVVNHLSKSIMLFIIVDFLLKSFNISIFRYVKEIKPSKLESAT